MNNLARAICATVLLFLAACQSSEVAAGPPAPELSSTAILQSYRLGTGDQIRLIVFGEEKMGGQFSVSDNGKLSLPLIGAVQASGLTLTELTQEITAALKDGYYRDPRVSVDIMVYRPFYILGEVQRAGNYPYTSGLTVQGAVALAGGFTYRADTKRVYIKHDSETQEQVYQLTTTTPVAPGDTIRIGERHF